MVSPELAPLVRIGGIAEGLAGLCRALQSMGAEPVVVLPDSETFDTRSLRSVPGPPRRVEVEGAFLPVAMDELDDPSAPEDGRAAPLRVIRIQTGMPRPRGGLWGSDLLDDASARHFGLFARAVAQLVEDMAAAGDGVGVVHAHDWVSAMVLYLLRERAWAGAPSPPRRVLSLHNLAFQGVFPRDALRHLGLGVEHFTMDRLEFFGHANFLKGGMVSADDVVAVSPTYAKEIVTREHGELLDGVLGQLGPALHGVVNGIDTHLWDPGRDPYLPAPFEALHPEGKARCKEALLADLGLASRVHRPLAMSLGRIVEQKGSDVLAAALPALADQDVTVLVAGGGDEVLAARLGEGAARTGGRARYLGRVDDGLAHRLVAASDLVLMPSRYEPCGIVQLYGQRYGAVPVARRTGGLSDTIDDAGTGTRGGGGTGFLYDGEGPVPLVAAVERAVALYGTPQWDVLRHTMMSKDVGWRRPALEYLKIYAGRRPR